MDWSKYSPEELKIAEKVLNDLGNAARQIRDNLYTRNDEWYQQYDREACGIAAHKQEVERTLDALYHQGKIENR